MTFPKSHSKQGYHDARKAQWGDLFPFTPKSKAIERTRGVRKLNKIQPDPDVEGVMNELLGSREIVGKQKGKRRNHRVMRNDETAPALGEMSEEVVEREADRGEDGDEVLVWQSQGNGDGGSSSTISKEGGRRSISTSALHSPPQNGQSPSLMFSLCSSNVQSQPSVSKDV